MQLVLFLCILPLHALLCQSPYVFRTLTKKDGLSQVSVFAVEQDSSGFIWLGTRDGLNRYDGYAFKVFKNEEISSSIVSNDVRILKYQQQNNCLWIGTIEGISRFDLKSQKFQNYKNTTTSNILPGNDVRCIFIDKDNKVWIGTNNGLAYYEPSTNQLITVFQQNNISVDCMMYTDSGTLLIGTSNGLYRLSQNTKPLLIPFDSPKEVEIGLNKANIKALLQDKDGRIWIGCHESGLIAIDKFDTDPVYHRYKSNKKKPKGLSNDNIRALTLGIDNKVWVGTFNGLNIYNAESDNFEVLKKSENNTSHLSDSSIKSIFKDKRGGMWVGTYYGGVNYSEAMFHKFKNFTNSIYDANSLSSDIVSSFAEEANGNLWIGTEGGGLNYYNRFNNTFKSYNYDENDNNTISGNNVKQILLHDNKLWIGTFTKGFCSLDLKTNKVTRYGTTNSALSNNNVYDLDLIGDKLWIGTFGSGLNVFDIRSQQFENKRIQHKKLSSEFVRVIMKDNTNDKIIWVGTERGLNMCILDTTNTISLINYYLLTQQIYALHQDKHGNIWIGTLSNGIYKLDVKKKTLLNFSKSNGLAGNTIFGILEDDISKLWLSTNYGLSKLDPNNQLITNYTTANGIVNTEYNFNAYSKSNSGDLLFGGINGFTRFNPSDIKSNEFIPNIAFTALMQNNNLVIPNGKSSVIDADINYCKNIEFDYNEANFSLSFAALDYLSPASNHYSYKLEGLDKDWITTIGEHEVHYTLQNEGKYVFRLKGSNSDGIWNAAEKQITIVVNPPFWRSWWAYLVYIGILSFAVLSFYRYLKLRTSLHLENYARLQEQDLHEAKLRFFTNITHELRTPLTLIHAPVKKLLEKPMDEESVHRLKMIEKNTQRLLNLVNQVLTFRAIESDQEPILAANKNLTLFLKEIFLPFTETALNRSIEYTFESDDDTLMVFFDEEKLEKVCFNLIANAFKFTNDGGKIKVRLTKDDNEAIIEVIDNGIGIEDLHKDQVFQRFYEKQHPQHSEIKGTGIGLALSKQLVEMHHGTISFGSIVGQGTTFKVRLLLGDKLFKPNEIVSEHSKTKVKQFDSKATINLLFGDTKESAKLCLTNEVLPFTKKEKLLIIDDNPDIRELIHSVFEQEYEINEASNGKEAIALIKKTQPSLIICDIMMPIMDGIAFTKRIKSDIEISHIPIILLTARTTSMYRLEGLAVGADDYITKPFEPEELVLRARNLIQAREDAKHKFVKVMTLDPKIISVTSADEEFLNNALGVIEKNMDNYNYSVDQFASDLMVSRALLFVKLKNLTNQTPNNFIKTIKLKRAAQLLETGKLTVSEVAHKVGFKDPKYFRKVFQEQFDVNPSKYIEEVSAED